MVQHDNVLLSDDIFDHHFVCDLTKCKGACCVEGDAGAPLEESELDLLEKDFTAIKPYLSPVGLQEIENQGLYTIDDDGDFTTPIIKGRECAYAVYEESGLLACGIEKAWKEGKTTFQKPMSCHLYPIRAKTFGEQTVLNYDRWHICAPACDLGKSLKIRVFEFLKAPLIRKFGEKWYQELDTIASELTLIQAKKR